MLFVPNVVVGCLVEHENKVVICRRSIAPSYGLWTLPAGYMELGESAAKGAARDNLEEAQADAQVVTHPDVPLIGQRKRKKEKKQEVGTGSGFDLQGERKKEKKRKPTPSQTVEEVGTAGGFEVQGKKKKEKKREFSPSQTVDEVITGSGFEAQGKRKKEKKREFSPSQTVEDVGTGSEFEVQDKRKKEKKREPTPSQTVEEVGTAGGFEVQGKRKKEKKREFSPSQTGEEVGTGSGFEAQGKRKKEKKRRSHPSQTVQEVGTGNGLELVGKKEKKRREFTPPTTVEDVDEAGIGSGDESRRKRRKKDKSLTTSQTLEDCRPKTGTAKKTILTTQETQTGTGAESVRKKKKVTFQLPDSTQDDPSENELLGEETETMHTSTDLKANPWITDKLRPDLVWGAYTPQEDGALKQAIFDYIQEQGWDREDGLKKILNSKNSEARGCWYIIRKSLPQRNIKRLYTRAHRLFDAGNYLGKWTSEETQSLIELHSVHGNNWKKISTIIGRDALNCKDKWRYVKFSDSNGRKTGLWSEEEHQKLCALVLKCLHVRRQMAKKGQLRKHHRVVRDDINWEFIAEQMDGRNRLDCMNQWYRKMASPMVTTGDWSNGDDQRLLERLTEEFPLSEELVEWDSLLEHRSGEICKRRWEQMQRSLGRGPVLRHLHFLEKLAGVVTLFAPHLADPEYDPQFAEELEQADADESEDNVDT